jgi:hypothetical protein
MAAPCQHRGYVQSHGKQTKIIAQLRDTAERHRRAAGLVTDRELVITLLRVAKALSEQAVEMSGGRKSELETQ